MSRIRSELGQVTVLTAVFMVGMIGMTALVVDVGSWFRSQRVSQSTVDAAALAGAQALPADPTAAASLAVGYGNENGGGISPSSITISSTYQPNDTITVKQAHAASGFFGSVLGITAVTVHAHATAMIGVPTEAQYVAPIAVNIKHPDLQGTPGCPCFGQSYTTTLPLGKTGAPGAFDLLNLNYDQTKGTVGESTLASWLQDGYTKYLPLGGYFSDPGAKYNGNEIDNALDARTDTDLLFPVYDTLTSSGSNASYHVIAWVGFHLLPGSYLQGSSGQLNGYFTKVIWDGLLPVGGPSTAPDLGVQTVALVD